MNRLNYGYISENGKYFDIREETFKEVSYSEAKRIESIIKSRLGKIRERNEKARIEHKNRVI